MDGIGFNSKSILRDNPESVTVVLSASGWNATAKTQTVTVPGISSVETDQMIIPTPASASKSTYNDAGVVCTAQGANSLTFTASTVPEVDLTVYVVITTLAK